MMMLVVMLMMIYTVIAATTRRRVIYRSNNSSTIISTVSFIALPLSVTRRTPNESAARNPPTISCSRRSATGQRPPALGRPDTWGCASTSRQCRRRDRCGGTVGNECGRLSESRTCRWRTRTKWSRRSCSPPARDRPPLSHSPPYQMGCWALEEGERLIGKTEFGQQIRGKGSLDKRGPWNGQILGKCLFKARLTGINRRVANNKFKSLALELGHQTDIIQLENWMDFPSISQFTHCSRTRQLLSH